MILDDKCFKCAHKSVIEKEHDAAKTWWEEYHVRYIFPCGAFFHPVSGFAEVHPGHQCSNIKGKLI